jgi:hypothetical protein
MPTGVIVAHFTFR